METSTTEVVQDTSAEAASSPSSSVSGDTSPSAAESGGGEGVSSEWNGELESIKSQPWWSTLPEQARATVENGLKSKYGNWQRGYQSKFEEFKKGQQSWQQEKSELQKSLDAAKDNGEWLQRLLGSDDSTAELNEKISSLTKALEEKDGSLSSLQRERDEWQNRYLSYEEQVVAKEAEVFDAKFKADFPDIYEDYKVDEAGNESGAFANFLKLIEAGYDSDTAAKMTRAIMPQKPQPPGPRKVEPPPSVRASKAPGDGPNPTSTRTAKEFNSYDDAIRALRQQAMGDVDDE
jgi:hypothetical protein